MQAPLCPPASCPIRLNIVEAITGVPESTLRDAIQNGELDGLKVKNSWHTTLESYERWIKATGKRRGDLQGDGNGQDPACESRSRQTGSRAINANQERSGSSLEQAGKPKKRRRRRGLAIIYDIRDQVDRGAQEEAGTEYGEEL